MLDLFGFDDAATKPQTAPPRGLMNASLGFAEFWAAWPAGPRKVAKQQALNKWATFGCANNHEHIRAHVEWLKTQNDWLCGFVPQPVTYLNQQRWLDWVPTAAPAQKPPDALQTIKQHKGSPMPENVRQRLALLRGAHA